MIDTGITLQVIKDTIGPILPNGTKRRIQGSNGDWFIEKSVTGSLHVYRDTRLSGVAFMPFLGEFGVLIGDHLRFVHTYNADYKIVFCERGQECLFPTAAEFRYDWKNPLPDRRRAGSAHTHRVVNHDALVKSLPPGIRPVMPRRGGWGNLVTKFFPEASPMLPVVDVVIAPRTRQFAQHRNYKHWEVVAADLVSRGLTVGVAGQPDTSVDISCASTHAWKHPNGATEGTVDLLSNCRMFVGSDSGVAHLAAMMNCPSMILPHPECGEHKHTEIKNTHKGFCKVLFEAWDDPQVVLSSIFEAFQSNTTARITSIGDNREELVACAAGTMRRFMPNVRIEILSNVGHVGFPTMIVDRCRDRASRIHKISQLLSCPTDYGIVIDDDTAVLQPFNDVKSVLDTLGTDIAMAVDPFVTTVGAIRQHAEQRRWSSVEENDYTLKAFPDIGNKPHFNSGVIFFKNTESVERLCKAWLEEWDRFKDIDQLPLARAIEVTGIKVGILPADLHYRMGLGNKVSKPSIVHFTGNKWTAHKWKVNAGIPVGATPDAGEFVASINKLTGADEPISQLHTTLLRLSSKLRPRKYGEIGSRYGHSAAAVSIASKTTEVFCFDFPNAGYGGVSSSDVILRKVMSNVCRGRHTLKFGDSAKLRDDIVASGPYDMFLVDGNHSVESCAYDFETAIQATQPTGVIVVDDLILHPDLGRWFNTIVKTYSSRILRVETRMHLTPQEKALKALHRGIGIVYLKPVSTTCCGGAARLPGTPATASPVKDALKDMQIAGPPLWEELHVYCAINSTAPLSDINKWVLDDWLQRIPCPECQAAFHRWLTHNPVTGDPFIWSVKAHNYVNVKRAMPELPYTPELRLRYNYVNS